VLWGWQSLLCVWCGTASPDPARGGGFFLGPTGSGEHGIFCAVNRIFMLQIGGDKVVKESTLLKGEAFSPASFYIHVLACAHKSLPCNTACSGLAAAPLQGRAVEAKQKLMLVKRLKERDICKVSVQRPVVVSRSWQQIVPRVGLPFEMQKRQECLFFFFPCPISALAGVNLHCFIDTCAGLCCLKPLTRETAPPYWTCSVVRSSCHGQ